MHSAPLCARRRRRQGGADRAQQWSPAPAVAGRGWWIGKPACHGAALPHAPALPQQTDENVSCRAVVTHRLTYAAVRHEQCGRAGCQQIPSIDLHYPRMASLLRAVRAIRQVVPNSHVSVQMNVIRGRHLLRLYAPQAANKDHGCHEFFHGGEGERSRGGSRK